MQLQRQQSRPSQTGHEVIVSQSYIPLVFCSVTSDSADDPDSDGTRTPPRPLSVRTQRRNEKKRARRLTLDVVPQVELGQDMEVTDAPIMADTIPSLRAELQEKTAIISQLNEDSNNLSALVRQSAEG